MKIKKSKKATSIVEALVVMLIITTGVTGMYKIYSESIKLSNSTTNKIQAIQIASQGIEGFTNIRDTNWILFSSDYKNCWNTFNYDPNCIGASNQDHAIENGESYSIYIDGSNRWRMEKKNSLLSDYTNSLYRDNFRMYRDSRGIYTQTGSLAEATKPQFTRELNIEYLPNGLSTDQKIKLTSIVQRADSSSTENHIIEIEQILTNWKK